MPKLILSIIIFLQLGSYNLGIYNWGFKQDNVPATSNSLEWSVERSSQFPVDTIRLYLGYHTDYRYNIGEFEPQPSQTNYLQMMADLPAYRKVWESNRFHTIILTTYAKHQFNRGINSLEKTYQEYYNLAVYLGQFPHIKFILSTWESNWDGNMYGQNWQYYIEDMRMRVIGIRAASQPNVFSCSEFNLIDSTENVDIIQYLLYIDSDYISYSAWQSTQAYWNSTDSVALRERIISDIDIVNGRTGYKWYGERFIIGEFGKDKRSPMDSLSFIRAITYALQCRNMKYAFYWQGLEDISDSLSLMDSYGNITTNGYAFFQASMPTIIRFPGGKKGVKIY